MKYEEMDEIRKALFDTIKTLDIEIKEWRDKVNGNTYQSGQIIINFGMKDSRVYHLPFCANEYSDGYIQRTMEKYGIIPESDTYFHKFLEQNKIIYRYHKEKTLKKIAEDFGKIGE